MSALYEFGPYRLEPDEERLLRDGSTVPLTPKAFDTLVCLVRRAGTLVDKDALMREVWPDAHVEDANITVNISTIRKALGDGVEGQRYIETVPKRGYRFVAPVRQLEGITRPHVAQPLLDRTITGPTLPLPVPDGPGPAATPAEAPRRLGRRGFWMLLAGSVPLAGAAAALGSLWASRSSATSRSGFPWERMATRGKLRLLLSSETGASSATLSPAGHMLAYVATDAVGRTDLFVAQVTGGGQLRLTSDAARESQPAFSPDGRSLAFTRRLPPSTTPEICIVPTLGGRAPRGIINGVDPAWAPQGTRLVYIGQSRPDGPQALFTCNLDGGDTRQILGADGTYPFLRHPAWSPDGYTIAVVRSPGGVAGEIWLVPLDGAAPRRLTEQSTHTWSDWPRFTADGGAILHTSSRGGATNLWVQPLPAGAPVRLTAGPGPDEVPSISRDGAVVFVNSHGRNELIVHDAVSRTTRTILTHTPFLWGPVLSPDGGDISFSRGEADGSWHIWTVPAAGGAARQLTSGTQSEIHPRYTRDGASVVYQTWGSPSRIWIVSRNGGTPRPLTAGDQEDGYADPSPDGELIAFARAEGEERVYVGPIAGGAPRRLVARASTTPRWSPDGQWIAFSPGRNYDRGIFIVRRDGTGERRLTERGGWPGWWPDGARVSFLMLDADGAQQIWTVPIAGGAPTRLESLPFPGSTNCPFDIGRDGRSIVTTRVIRTSHEIWLLEPPGPEPPTE
jgi:Tol biopolymer transport system component/DNA-binding winged helix-turn-helix (wHTH) protein